MLEGVEAIAECAAHKAVVAIKGPPAHHAQDAVPRLGVLPPVARVVEDGAVASAAVRPLLALPAAAVTAGDAPMLAGSRAVRTAPLEAPAARATSATNALVSA